MLTAKNVLGVRVDIGHGVDEFLLELHMSGVSAVLHASAKLDDHVPWHKLAMFTVKEVNSTSPILLLEAANQCLVHGFFLGRGTVAPLGSLIRGHTTPSDRSGAFLKEAVSPLSSDPSQGTDVWSFCSFSACDIGVPFLNFYPHGLLSKSSLLNFLANCKYSSFDIAPLSTSFSASSSESCIF